MYQQRKKDLESTGGMRNGKRQSNSDKAESMSVLSACGSGNEAGAVSAHTFTKCRVSGRKKLSAGDYAAYGRACGVFA